MFRSRTGTALLIVAGALSAGCGSGSQTQSEQDRQAEEYARSLGADVDVKTSADGTRSVTVGGGIGGATTQAGSNLSMPAGFPDDVPVYPRINLASVSQIPGAGFMLQGQSDDSIDAVTSFYADEMKSRGWAQDAGQQMPAGRMLQFAKGDRKVSLTLFPSGGGTTVQLMTLQ